MSEQTRRRLTPATIATGAMGSLILALSLNGTMAGFVASIENTVNTAGTGVLEMTEANSDGTVTCTSDTSGSAVDCATINKYGGDLTMGPGEAPIATTITINNSGTIDPDAFTLTPGTCTSTPAGGDLCTVLEVRILENGTEIKPWGTASAWTTPITLDPPAVGDTNTYVFETRIADTADNTMQDKVASQPMTWSFTA